MGLVVLLILAIIEYDEIWEL